MDEGPAIGVVVFAGDGDSIGAVDLGRAVEDRGFESLFLPEHTHMPVQRTRQFVLDRPLPEIYKRAADPLITHAAIAATTERLVLGTSVTLIAQRDPVTTAKALATLDRLAPGRVRIGVGAGWNIEEMQHHGVDASRPWAVAREHDEAMRVLWADDVAEYHGRFVEFEPSWSWPKPVGGAIPILVGGDGPRALDRVLAWGDGWLPALDDEVEPLVARVLELRALRPDPEFDITVGCGYGRRLTAAEFAALAACGVTRLLLSLDTEPYADTIAALDAARAMAVDAGWRPE